MLLIITIILLLWAITVGVALAISHQKTRRSTSTTRPTATTGTPFAQFLVGALERRDCPRFLKLGNR